MISFWWLRHGPTHARGVIGWSDLPADLSDRAALEQLRDFLPARAVLVSSDLIRARATADAVAGPEHRRLPDAPALREFNFGQWEGLDFAAVAARDPELARRFWERPGAVAPPDGESWDQVRARVSDWVRRMRAETGQRHVIAVAHFGVILTQLQEALGVSAATVLGQPVDTLSLTRIDWDGAGPVAGLINHVP